MLDDAADVVERGIGQPRVAFSAKVFSPPLAMDWCTHPRTVVPDQRLGHKGGGLSIGVCNVQDAVFQNLHFVSFRYRRVEFDPDLTLAGRTYFVMVYFNIQAHLLHCGASHADIMQ